jgi:acetyl-CoA synthetase
MSDEVIHVSPAWGERAFIDREKYDSMYAHSLKDPEGFWREHARRIDWIKPFSKVKDVSWNPENLHIRWFEDPIRWLVASTIAQAPSF